MYTRHFGKKGLKIPENYCGNAFSEKENEEAPAHCEPSPDERPECVSDNQKKDSCERNEGIQSLFEKIGLDNIAPPDLLLVLLAFLLMNERTSDSELPLILLLLLILSD